MPLNRGSPAARQNLGRPFSPDQRYILAKHLYHRLHRQRSAALSSNGDVFLRAVMLYYEWYPAAREMVR